MECNDAKKVGICGITRLCWNKLQNHGQLQKKNQNPEMCQINPNYICNMCSLLQILKRYWIIGVIPGRHNFFWFLSLHTSKWGRRTCIGLVVFDLLGFRKTTTRWSCEAKARIHNGLMGRLRPLKPHKTIRDSSIKTSWFHDGCRIRWDPYVVPFFYVPFLALPRFVGTNHRGFWLIAKYL